MGLADGGTFGKERKEALRIYLNLIEEPLLDETAKVLEIQDARRLQVDPNYVAKNKQQWLQKFSDDTVNASADLQAQKAIQAKAIEQGVDLSEDTFQSTKKIRKFIGAGRMPKIPRGALIVGGIAGAGLLFEGLNVQARAADYENDPTRLNQIQLKMAQASLGIEGFDLGTGGSASAVTIPSQLLLWGGESVIDQIEKDDTTHSDFNVKYSENISNFIGTE